jgi:hypothetical protein
MRANNIGSGRVHWMQASPLTSSLAPLTKGLAPYPTSASWTPTTPRPAPPTRDQGFPTAWAGLAALAAVLALTFWRLRTLRRKSRLPLRVLFSKSAGERTPSVPWRRWRL